MSTDPRMHRYAGSRASQMLSMACLFCFGLAEFVTGGALSLCMSAALSSDTSRVTIPRVLSAAISALMAGLILVAYLAPYFVFIAESLVTITLSTVVLAIVGLQCAAESGRVAPGRRQRKGIIP